ncbi:MULTISPECIES: dTMP kinase [unclassified Campylobacter]|uniref:dTMP kinase n=1 Tax=unclassified Campylobacter TaxID=2593542 RepID=UPI001238054F|nr:MULTISPECIES: dTMP kinase [unclassified Campylobacter]KAA6226347.1 dTMP kinase [Campylobacter sp. LR286c]KAA6226615.1 dTMP kinase [Campylobacter sp. LR185c]KAA6226839.1 dTMP kinase [Campylobacter sp. LR196d]KAA6230276.1 dTMP kinase [Campylobacter sp. LR291e]KAA6233797.1 dTMP kinase [Campylobacter sp. LR264d]
MYVAFEGIDCMGKSTQIELLKNDFKDAIFTMEPGGTEFGKHLRELLLNKPFTISKRAELFLFLADRTQHFEEILNENKNKLIISDRSFISGIAYAKDFDKDFLLKLNIFALNEYMPQKIVFLKGDENLINQRFKQKSLDSIEKRGVSYFLDVQKNIEEVLFLLKDKTKILTLNASDSIEILHKKIKEFIND